MERKKKPASIGACRGCLFWQGHGPHEKRGFGRCIRFPPQVVGREFVCPETWRGFMCGEFVDRDERDNSKGVRK